MISRPTSRHRHRPFPGAGGDRAAGIPAAGGPALAHAHAPLVERGAVAGYAVRHEEIQHDLAPDQGGAVEGTAASSHARRGGPGSLSVSQATGLPTVRRPPREPTPTSTSAPRPGPRSIFGQGRGASTAVARKLPIVFVTVTAWVLSITLATFSEETRCARPGV